MNINEHPIYKNIYDLCQEIEKLPASEQATKVVVMASALENPVRDLLEQKKVLVEALQLVERHLIAVGTTPTHITIQEIKQALAATQPEEKQ